MTCVRSGKGLGVGAIFVVAVGVAGGAAVGMGVAVGACVGAMVGEGVSVGIGVAVGACVGAMVGVGVGAAVGMGVAVGVCVGATVGVGVGAGVTLGCAVTVGVGTALADGVGLGASEHPVSSMARSIAPAPSNPRAMDFDIIALLGARLSATVASTLAFRMTRRKVCLYLLRVVYLYLSEPEDSPYHFCSFRG